MALSQAATPSGGRKQKVKQEMTQNEIQMRMSVRVLRYFQTIAETSSVVLS